MAQQKIVLPYKWKPRTYQIPVWSYLEAGGRRAVVLWHRRAGKDAVAINWCATSCFRRVGLYWHVLPTYDQGRKIVWEGITATGQRFLDAFPGHDHPGVPHPVTGDYGIVKRKRDDKMFLELTNGSVFQVVGTDDIDRLVGANPVGVVFSEFSLHNPAAWDYIRPILAENGGWALFIFTMRGKNHGYQLFKMAQKIMRKAQPGTVPDWFAENLTVNDTKREDGSPVITPEAIEAEREAGMSEEMVQQEFFNDPNAAAVGAYYAKEIAACEKAGRVRSGIYDPALPVDTYWDLGMNDTMSIIFTQQFRNEIRIVDYYDNSGFGMNHYAKVLQEKPYTYGQHFAPHDIKVRELSGEGVSRLESARKLGINFRVVPKYSQEDKINAVRLLFARFWFDADGAERLIEAIKDYQKRWDAVKRIFLDEPLHNWASHPCDALAYMALAIKRPLAPPTQTHAETNVGNALGQRPVIHPAEAETEYDPYKH